MTHIQGTPTFRSSSGWPWKTRLRQSRQTGARRSRCTHRQPPTLPSDCTFSCGGEPAAIVCKGMDDDPRFNCPSERKQSRFQSSALSDWRTLYKEDAGRYIPRKTLRVVAKIYQVIQELEQDAIQDDILDILNLERFSPPSFYAGTLKTDSIKNGAIKFAVTHTCDIPKLPQDWFLDLFDRNLTTNSQ
ncbi:hypothetical protein P4S72_10640 [Vibrio sp. PP-XX7]